MKFAVICSFLPSIIKFRSDLLEKLSQKGFEIHILAPDLHNYQYDVGILKSKGYFLYDITMQRTGTNPIVDLKTFFLIYQSLKQIKPNYVLSYTIKPVIYGMLAANLVKISHRFALITGLGYSFNNVQQGKYSLFQKVICLLYTLSLRNTEKVFFQNPDDKDLFLQLGLLKSNKAYAIVNGSGVNVSEFQVVDLPINNSGREEISFLLIARLLADKGIREYVFAAREIKKQYPHIIFNLVGWIDENPSSITQQELDSWISEDVVRFWGKLSDVKSIIQKSSIYVLPSYREGTPRTVLEAMAMGRPIITTDAPGCRETVLHGENGYLVEVRSVESLEQAMRNFINNPSLIRKMGQRSRQIALEKYDVHQVNLHMLNEMGIK